MTVVAKQNISYPKGIHVPSLTWFRNDAEQEIDWALQRQHIEFLVKSGVAGVVIGGTNGEAVTLTRDEKTRLVKETRAITTQLGADIDITVGTSGQCTRDVIAETRAAAEAGGDYALVLVPSYFHFAMHADAIVAFFTEVAEASLLPIIIYNFPGVAAGLDVDSDMLDRLARVSNIAGVKLTCGGIAKVARVAAKHAPEEFAALAGQSDWLVPALSVGATGAITGVANLYPKVCIQVYNLYVQGNVKAARELQLQLAKMEWSFAKGGINGTKWVVARMRGYPEGSWACRRPYPAFDEKRRSWMLELVNPLASLEESLQAK